MTSDQLRSYVRISPFILTPVLISTVDLVGLEVIKKGPLYFYCNPLVSCCLAYTWVTLSDDRSSNFCGLVDVGIDTVVFYLEFF